MRVGIHEQEPVPRGGFGPAISSAGDLVDRFEDDHCAGGTGDIGCFIGGIVVANDEFGFPTAFVKSAQGSVDVAQGVTETAFFVICRDDDGDFQAA